MNILEIEDLIKGLPDQALMQEAQRPSGRMPQYLVVSEIQRRGDMRKRFQSQQQGQDRGTIAQQILQGGVQERPAPQTQAPMGQPPAMMPPMGAQRPPMPPQGTPPGPPMGAPQGIAALPQARGIPGPQAAQMAAQAPVRMADGQRVPGSDPTLGQRLNNPFNLRDYNQGFVGATGAEDGFLRFDDPLAGIRAADRVLNTYGRDRGINTLAALLDTFAPPSENPTQDYLAYVAERSGFGPDQEIDLTNPYVRERILTPMGAFESQTDVTQDMIRRAREIGQPVSELASSTIAVERPTLMSGLAPSALPSEDPGRGTGSQFTLASQLSGAPGEQQEQVGAVLREVLGETNVPFTRQFVNPDVYDPERQAEIERGLGARKDLQYLYGAAGPEQQQARAAEIASRFPVMALAGAADGEPTIVSDPSQSAAVKGDASKVVTGGPEAGDVPGARTDIDPATMDAALQSGDPDAKARQDAGAPRLGGDPTGSYNLGDVSGIGSVGAAQTLLDETTAAVPTFTEEGALESIGNPLAEYQAKRIREAELPGRSYQELIDKVMERSGRDYGEGTAAAAAIRAESEAEQQRLKEEGRSAALSDALIALGAGIAGGDLSGGLSRAGQAATAARKEFETAARQERRYGTLEARAEERAAMAARSAAEAQQLGLMGRQVEADYEANLAKINRDLEADKVLASAAERMGADRRAAEQFLVSTRAKAESLMAQLAQLDQEDRKQAELSSRAIADFLEEVVKGDLPAGLQMKSPEEQANYRRRVIRQYIPDLEAVFGRKIELEDIEDGPAVDDAGRPSLSAFKS